MPRLTEPMKQPVRVRSSRTNSRGGSVMLSFTGGRPIMTAEPRGAVIEKALLNGFGAAQRDEDVVGARTSRELLHRADRIALSRVIAWVAPNAYGGLQLPVHDVDGNDGIRAGKGGALKHVQANAAAADHDHAAHGFDPHTVDHRPESGNDGACQERGSIHGHIGRYFDCLAFFHDHVFGKASGFRLGDQRLAGAVAQTCLRVQRPRSATQMRKSAGAIEASAAVGNESHHHRIALMYGGDSFSGFHHGSGALVSRYKRQRPGQFALDVMDVAVAYARGGHANLDLAFLRRIDFHIFNDEGFPKS